MNYFFIIIALVFIVYVFMVIKRKEFPIEESIFWIFSTLILLVLAIFPKLIDKISFKLNISYPPSFLFLLAIIFLLFINFRDTKKIEKQKERITELAQKVSILEYDVDNMKKNNKNV